MVPTLSSMFKDWKQKTITKIVSSSKPDAINMP